MTKIVSDLAPQIWSEIQKAQKILLHCHVNPDGDSIGGALGMKLALESVGKNVSIFWADQHPDSSFNKLPGFYEILSNTFSEVVVNNFDLFIIQDSSSIRRISKTEDITFPKSLKSVIIDHHEGNSIHSDLKLVDSSYSSVSEIIYELLSSWRIKITKDIAICLYVGIYTDTGGFKYHNVTTNTYRIATELVSTGINFADTIFMIENSNDPNSTKYLGILFSSIEKYFNGRVAICSVSYSTYLAENIDPKIKTSETANIIKSEIGNDISIVLEETSPDYVEVSLRTRDSIKYDLSEIARGTGFGGGHRAAAGARIEQPLSEAKKLLIETIQRVYPELGKP